MMMPSIFGESLFDDFFDDDFFGTRRNVMSRNANVMKTDVRELDNSYELDIDLPGYKKEDLAVSLKDGYLTISTSKNDSHDEKNEEGQYIRRERYVGTMTRSFYVGDDITESDIGARFEDGILKLSVPKKQPVVEEKKYIEIK